MLGFGKRQPPLVLWSHWCKLIENLAFSPEEFYDRTTAGLVAREIPKLKEQRVRINEGGLLAVGLYAAWLFMSSGQPSFGRSSRFDRVGPSVNVWQIAYSLTVLIAMLTIIALLLRKVIAFALKDVDGAILQIPLIGPLYERFIRQMTYYRVDIALMFQQAVHAAVTEVVDEITSAKGLPLLTADERKPIFNDLYRR